MSHRVIDNYKDISTTRFFDKIQLVSVSHLEKVFDLESRTRGNGRHSNIGLSCVAMAGDFATWNKILTISDFL